MKIKIAKIRAHYANIPPRHKPIAMLFVIVFCLLLLILLFKGCQAIAANKNKLPLQPMMIHEGNKIIVPSLSPLRAKIITKTVTASTLPHIISVPGLVEADPALVVNILPPLTGRIISLNVNWGEQVKKNQILAVISSPDLAQAYADNDKANAQLKLATESLRRAKAVHLAGGNSTKMVEQTQNDYIQALADVQRTKNRLTTLGNNTSSLLTITAPIEGRITSLNYGIGSYINDPNAALMTITNMNAVWVIASIPENMVGLVTKDQQVDVRMPAYPAQILHGKIAFVSTFLDPDTHRNKAAVVFPNEEEKLQLNMFCTVDITVPQPNQILVPLSAILMNNDTTSIYVETSPWSFQNRLVQLGAEDGDMVRVVTGLVTGERIVESGGIFIND